MLADHRAHRSERIEAALKQDAAARERLRRLTRADELVREAYRLPLDEPVPDHLRDAVERADSGDRVVRLNPAARLTARARETYRPAAGDTQASLRELRPSWQAATPLDAERERAAIDAGWTRPAE